MRLMQTGLDTTGLGDASSFQWCLHSAAADSGAVPLSQSNHRAHSRLKDTSLHGISLGVWAGRAESGARFWELCMYDVDGPTEPTAWPSSVHLGTQVLQCGPTCPPASSTAEPGPRAQQSMTLQPSGLPSDVLSRNSPTCCPLFQEHDPASKLHFWVG